MNKAERVTAAHLQLADHLGHEPLPAPGCLICDWRAAMAWLDYEGVPAGSSLVERFDAWKKACADKEGVLVYSRGGVGRGQQ